MSVGDVTESKVLRIRVGSAQDAEIRVEGKTAYLGPGVVKDEMKVEELFALEEAIKRLRERVAASPG